MFPDTFIRENLENLSDEKRAIFSLSHKKLVSVSSLCWTGRVHFSLEFSTCIFADKKVLLTGEISEDPCHGAG